MATLTKKLRHRENLKKNTQILIDSNIPFIILNNGIHLKLGNFDYYPSTDLFLNAISGERGYGVEKLIKLLKEQNPLQKISNYEATRINNNSYKLSRK